MFALTFIVAASVSALAGLPGDYARRRLSRETANLLNLANAAGVLAAIGLIAALGIVHGFAGITALVLGLASGQQLADAAAERTWGAAVGVR